MAAAPLASSSGERTKVVVRNLPPGLTVENFLAILNIKLGWQPDSGAWTWMCYYQGKVSVKRTVFSRAYLNMASPLLVLELKAKLDGHTFVSTRGTQYRCSVEYAPFQKIPQHAKKRNPLEGTIEQDPDYQAFLKELEEGPALLPSAAAQREQQEKQGTPPDAAPPTNPLLEYLKARHLANPGMRLGGVRRNKPKAAADTPEPASARDRGKGKDNHPAGKDDKGRPGQRGKGGAAEKASVVAAANSAAALAVAAAMGGATGRRDAPQKGAGKGDAGDRRGAQQQQGRPRSAAPQAAAAAVQEAEQQQRPASAAPKVLLGRSGGSAGHTPQKDSPAQVQKGQEVQSNRKQQQRQGGAPDHRQGQPTPTTKPASAQPATKPAAAQHQRAPTGRKEAQPSSAQQAALQGGSSTSAGGGAAAGSGRGQAPSQQSQEAGASGDGASKRRVRAGFAAYRPPVRPSAGDGG